MSTFPAWGGPADAIRAASAEAAGDDLPAPAAPPPTLTHVPRAERRGGDLSAVAIQDLSTALVGGGDALDGAAAMALEALWRGLDARAAMLYLRPAARRFLVLPMHARGVPVGMVCLDASEPQDLRPDEQVLRLARTLRNQLLALPP